MRYTFMYVSPTLPLTGGPGPFYYLAYLHAKTGSPQAVTGKEGSARGLGMLAPLMPPRLCHNVSAASYIQEKRWDSVGLSSKPQSSRGHSLLWAWEIPRLRTRQREREWELRMGQDDGSGSSHGGVACGCPRWASEFFSKPKPNTRPFSRAETQVWLTGESQAMACIPKSSLSGCLQTLLIYYGMLSHWGPELRPYSSVDSHCIRGGL